jgi:hypothetical protein
MYASFVERDAVVLKRRHWALPTAMVFRTARAVDIISQAFD